MMDQNVWLNNLKDQFYGKGHWREEPCSLATFSTQTQKLKDTEHPSYNGLLKHKMTVQSHVLNNHVKSKTK